MNVSHGFHIFRDGEAWCAVGPHFIDLMKSDAGFGETPEQAVADLTGKFVHQSWWQNKPFHKLEEFTTHHPADFSGQEPQVTRNPDGTTTWTDNTGSETR